MVLATHANWVTYVVFPTTAALFLGFFIVPLFWHVREQRMSGQPVLGLELPKTTLGWVASTVTIGGTLVFNIVIGISTWRRMR